MQCQAEGSVVFDHHASAVSQSAAKAAAEPSETIDAGNDNQISGCEVLDTAAAPELTPSSAQLAATPHVPADVLLKAAAKQGHRLPDGLQDRYKLLARLSHLHLNGLQLEHLDSLKLCPKLQVLYLYDNQLGTISNLSSCRQITHLYLQNNRLTSLQGLQDLPLLQKLYVQGNCLQQISCLAAATRLQELHVSDQQQPQQCTDSDQQSCAYHQQQQHKLIRKHACAATPLAAVASSSKLPDHATSMPCNQLQHQLHFDPASLHAMAGSLRVLCAAGCGIVDPAPLQMLQGLRLLDLSRNLIRHIADMHPLLQCLQQLQQLDIRQNPAALGDPKYRDYLILNGAGSLATIDGQTVPQPHRAFLMGRSWIKKNAQQLACAEQCSIKQVESGNSSLRQVVNVSSQEEFSHDSSMAGRFCPPVARQDGIGTCTQLNAGSLIATSMQLHGLRAHHSRHTAAGGFNMVTSNRCATGSTGHGHAHQLHQLMLWDDIELDQPHE